MSRVNRSGARDARAAAGKASMSAPLLIAAALAGPPWPGAKQICGARPSGSKGRLDNRFFYASSLGPTKSRILGHPAHQPRS
jgi:hypothetical protein